MLRMELLSSVFVRAIIISIGYFIALHLAYKIKPSKRSIIDGVLILGLIIVMSTRIDWILLKLMSYFVLGYLLLTLNHKVDQYAALLFSLVILIMTSFTDIISLNITAMSEPLLNAIIHQENTIYGFIAVMIPSVTAMSLYIVGGFIMKTMLDLTVKRSKVTYTFFSMFFLYLLVQISLILEDVIKHSSSMDSVKEVYHFVSFMYIPLIAITIFTFYYLYQILKWEKLIKSREDELIIAEHQRRDGYRANHNVDSIILTVHTLAKNKQYDDLKTYLDKL